MGKNELALRPSYWAAVSGGKDSLYMLNLILHNLNLYPLDGVVHFELEIDYPFIKNVIDYMESECTKHGIPFIRIKPRKTWMELYEERGFPSWIVRWCNGEYKMDARRQLQSFLREKGKYLVTYIGYCVDEKKRYTKRKNNNEVYPLVDSGISEDYILEWAKNTPIFNDYYKFNRRCGCMRCPMQSLITSAYLLKYYPDEYCKTMSLAKAHEQKMCKRFNCDSFSVFSGNPKYNVDYRDKRVREVYLPKLEKILSAFSKEEGNEIKLEEEKNE